MLVRSSGFIYTGDLYLSPDTENLDPFCFVLVSDIRLCLASMCATEPKCEINIYFTIFYEQCNSQQLFAETKHENYTYKTTKHYINQIHVF
mgnify:CR=1 FL=1